MFASYHNSNAYDLFLWAQQENSRIKASKILRAADRMEERYRKYRMTVELPHPTYGPSPVPPSASLRIRGKKLDIR